MKPAFFADLDRHGQLLDLCNSPAVAESIEGAVFYTSYDDFLKELPNGIFDCVIIAHKGAVGMQAVRAAKILMHGIPIVWLSDDSAFVEESYRNGCAYFSAERISEDILLSALRRCKKENTPK